MNTESITWAEAHQLCDDTNEKFPFGTRIRLIKGNMFSNANGLTGTVMGANIIRRGPYADSVALIIEWDVPDHNRKIDIMRDEFRLLTDDELKQDQALTDFANNAVENLKNAGDATSIMLPCNIAGTNVELTITLSVIDDDFDEDLDGNITTIDPYTIYEVELKRVDRKGKITFRRNLPLGILTDDVIPKSTIDPSGGELLLRKIRPFMYGYMYRAKLSKLHIYERAHN